MNKKLAEITLDRLDMYGVECSVCHTQSWRVTDAQEGDNRVIGFEVVCTRCDNDVIVRGSIQPYSGKLKTHHNGIRPQPFIHKPDDNPYIRTKGELTGEEFRRAYLGEWHPPYENETG